MEMVCVFKSEDGKIFESAAECVDYERRLSEQDDTKIIMRDMEGNPSDAASCELVYLGGAAAADKFIDMCNACKATYEGIKKFNEGCWFWWDDCNLIWEEIPWKLLKGAAKMRDEFNLNEWGEMGK